MQNNGEWGIEKELDILGLHRFGMDGATIRLIIDRVGLQRIR